VRRQRLEIERVVAGGDGLAREASGRVVFVPGALPGEVVDVEISGKAKKDFARARLIEVVDASPHRLGAPCAALARGCGGCDWQHVEPSAQLSLKVEIVREALRRTGRLADAEVVAGRSVSPLAYRTSMRLALDRDGRAGLRRERSNDAVPLDECLVAHDALSAMLAPLRIPGGDEVSLRVSASTGEATAWWTPESMRAHGLAEHVRTGSTAALTEAVVPTRLPRVDLRVSAASFFQSGPDAAAVLVDAVESVGGERLATARTVVDAYGGVGLFATTVAPAATELVLVEGSPSACADAQVNVAANLAGRDASVVESAIEDWRPTRADAVVADPSRQGLGRDAAEVLAATGAPLLVLVSCDPVSLARDATLLRDLGYAHESTTVVDLFPHTHHVEAVTRFVR
jgi:23S rRNA (uracil1939-C5)-methyltransferase